jgi:hypothetical protein
MRQDEEFERRIKEGFERQKNRGKSDAEIVRGGMDSMAWLVNNAHNHDDPEWEAWVRAAFEDREVALQALERLAPTPEVLR